MTPQAAKICPKIIKKTENFAKKYDIRLRKFKNIESLKMVSKLLNGQYLRSCEQLSKKIGFYSRFWGKIWIHKLDLLGYFCVHKNKKKLIKKWNSQRKFIESETPKIVSKRLKSLFLGVMSNYRRNRFTFVFWTPRNQKKRTNKMRCELLKDQKCPFLRKLWQFSIGVKKWGNKFDLLSYF